MAKFVTIGERLSVTAPTVNKAFAARDEEPILKRAKQQLDAGAVYLDVNIGPAENDGEDIMVPGNGTKLPWQRAILCRNQAINERRLLVTRQDYYGYLSETFRHFVSTILSDLKQKPASTANEAYFIDR